MALTTSPHFSCGTPITAALRTAGWRRQCRLADKSGEDDSRPGEWTLYPEGFGVERFIEVIETEAVWDEITPDTSA